MESCNKPSSYIPLTINIGVHVLILFTILSMLFMFFISGVEKSTINGQFESNLNNAFDKLDATIHSGVKAQIRSLTQNNQFNRLKQTYSSPNLNNITNNKWLFTSMIITNIALFIIVFITIVLLTYQCNQCIPIKHILLENAIIFAFVGVIEYMFFTKIALKYVPSKPSAVINSFFNSINNNF